VSNLITRKYKPLLDKLDLTYTQYIVMMVLWEEKQVNEKFLCEALCLKTNTLTPLLKALEQKGCVTRCRSAEDERVLLVRLTEAGKALEDAALRVPEQMRACVRLSPEEAATLYRLLYKLLDPTLSVPADGGAEAQEA
jgi:DNA-binding MarR family transcriptional regulator